MMYLFPIVCPACARRFEGGNHVQCPHCEEEGADNMHATLQELKRDVDQLKGEHVAYVDDHYTRPRDRNISDEEQRRLEYLDKSLSRVTSIYRPKTLDPRRSPAQFEIVSPRRHLFIERCEVVQ